MSIELKEIAVVFSNFETLDQAKAAAKQLMDENIATCVNIMAPHLAIYVWDERVQEEDEVAAIFKAPIERKEALIARLREIHPYQLPSIVSLEAESHGEYVQWLNDPYNYKPESLTS